ncbi:oxidoreductase [Cryptococcus neoformans Ze90-1]|nr:oxidoreductase [Cryptococcus neoformans var. grubii Ze90-1]
MHDNLCVVHRLNPSLATPHHRSTKEHVERLFRKCSHHGNSLPLEARGGEARVQERILPPRWKSTRGTSCVGGYMVHELAGSAQGYQDDQSNPTDENSATIISWSQYLSRDGVDAVRGGQEEDCCVLILRFVRFSSHGKYNAHDSRDFSSGIHTLSIPQYIICNVINLYMKLQVQFHLSRTNAEWPSRDQVLQYAGAAGQTHPGNRCLYGKTVGMLGYGHIARETARLFKAFNCNVIAANSKGNKRPEEGFRLPGTGDEDGSIPSQYYSTTDPESFKEFLSHCDVLVASLPSTPQTTYMLTEFHLRSLPEGAVFVNIGRGDLIRSEDILAALDAEGGLFGAVLDVTDPEPLPSGHPLFTHPSVIVTPHTSGSFEGYFDSGADVLLAQGDRLKQGLSPINVVDPAKGY